MSSTTTPVIAEKEKALWCDPAVGVNCNPVPVYLMHAFVLSYQMLNAEGLLTSVAKRPLQPLFDQWGQNFLEEITPSDMGILEEFRTIFGTNSLREQVHRQGFKKTQHQLEKMLAQFLRDTRGL